MTHRFWLLPTVYCFLIHFFFSSIAFSKIFIPSCEAIMDCAKDSLAVVDCGTHRCSRLSTIPRGYAPCHGKVALLSEFSSQCQGLSPACTFQSTAPARIQPFSSFPGYNSEWRQLDTRLVLRPVSVATDAGISQHVSCTPLTMIGERLSFFIFHLGHMTILTLNTCPFMFASPKGLSFRML